MVAAVCAWHVDHHPAANEILRRLSRGEQLVVAAPALVETYSVLTRLPSSHRLSPADALSLLEANFITKVKVISLAGRTYVGLLRKAATAAVSGGRAYDAVIAECAVEARATALLTLNEDHFREWESERLRAVVPRAKRSDR